MDSLQNGFCLFFFSSSTSLSRQASFHCIGKFLEVVIIAALQGGLPELKTLG